MRSHWLCTLLLAPALGAQLALVAPSDLAGRARAAAELRELLAADPDLPTTVAFAAFAGQHLAAGTMARHRLAAALVKANLTSQPAEARSALRVAIDDLVDTLAFVPQKQAELPVGFPGFSTVDEIELRSYPAYRMVRTSMQGGSNRAFWPLFRHIEQNGIAMTTPVQMDWQPTATDGDERPAQMAFLYGDPGITPESTAEGVEVVEVAAAQALSIGAIGDDRRDRVEQLRARLLAWLAEHPEWQVAGPLRTMGYNSPMVARDRRCFEVQLPVARRTAEIIR
jgi:hypothetical protein